MNLLTNAKKFAEQGAVTVRVGHRIQATSAQRAPALPTAAGEDAAQAWLVIEVADTGIGIAPTDQAVIFELFRQVDGDYGRRQEGIGLGLAITRHLVELMRGTIRVSSQLGAGSCFTITLPLRVEQSGA